MYIPIRSQLLRVSFSTQDIPDDSHPCNPGNVADHVSQLHIHQMQGFLHMLDMRRTVADQVIPMTGVGSQGTHFFFGPKRASQQAIGVQLLDPLTVQNIRLAPRNVLQLPGVD